MRLLEIRDSSSSPTYCGNDGHSASSCFETSSISFQPLDKNHKTKVLPKVMMSLPEIWDSSINYGGDDGYISCLEPSPSFHDPPEKKLTLFAQHLAIIEKSASALGQLAFIWATVVLLGGFASSLKPKDFWLVTIILVVEGARLFNRSSELKWHHHSTRTLPVATSRRLSYFNWVFVLKIFNHLLYWLQLFAAVVCVALSLMRLGQQDYGEDAEINKKSALNVFYGLALAVALMFLLEKGYWTWKIQLGKLVERVNEECKLGPIGLVSLRRFFYDAYSKCIDGSVFDGLKMDLVSYAEELLHSDSLDEQIIGASMFKIFLKISPSVGDVHRKIGSSTSVIERLIQMLNWKGAKERNIRFKASVIVAMLASTEQNALRVAAIPGAMESIASLLHTRKEIYEASPREDYEFSTLNLHGLLILEGLAKDHENCLKIGNARGLLARIIDLTSLGEALQCVIIMRVRQIWTVRSALQVVKILICTTGETGKTLQRDISRIVNLLSYIKDLLQYGENYLELQVLGMEILTSLGMNEEAREKIGATGSMMGLILNVFFRPIVMEKDETVCNVAGEALAMLTLESKWNCERMLRVDGKVAERLVQELSNPARKLNAAMILRSLCAYSAPERHSRLHMVVEALPMVLKNIMEEKEEEEKLLEVLVGLAQQILNCFGAFEFERVEIKKKDFVGKLVEILRRYKNPDSKVPRMRWFVIGLAITLMNYQGKYIEWFNNSGMKEVLVQTAETTSELEWFNVLSGSQGNDCHEEMISSLADKALQIIDIYYDTSDEDIIGHRRPSRRRPTFA